VIGSIDDDGALPDLSGDDSAATDCWALVENEDDDEE
jgi:hypothetical protein